MCAALGVEAGLEPLDRAAWGVARRLLYRTVMQRAPLGQLLVDAGVVTTEQLRAALAAQRVKGLRLGSTLIALGYADHDTVAVALAAQTGAPAARRKHFASISNRTRDLIGARLATACNAIPLGVSRRGVAQLVIAMRDPGDRVALDRLHDATGYQVRGAIAPESSIRDALRQLYHDEPELELAVERERPRAPGAPRTISADVGPRTMSADVGRRAVSADVEWRNTDSPRAVMLAMIAGLVAVLAMVVLLPRWFGGDGGEDVGGRFTSRHLGLEVAFPQGWRYLSDEDHRESMMGMNANGSLFYRGGTDSDPDLALMLMSVDSNGEIPTNLDEAEFSRVVYGMERDMLGFQQGEFRATELVCEVTWSRGPLTGECEGLAEAKQLRRNLMMYLWIDTGGILMVAGVLSRAPLDDVLGEIDEILDSIMFED